MNTTPVLTTTDADAAAFAPAVAALRAAVTGLVAAPGDDSYDGSRAAWNLLVDQRPAAVVVAGDEADVAATLRVAAEHGLQVAPQATGHNAGALGDLAACILLRTDRLTGVTVDPAAASAYVRAGTQWARVLAACAPHGLAPLPGSAGDVGVVGFTLGGGLSFLGRRHGLGTQQVLALDVVLADGTAVRATRTQHRDLFWALRGGGGAFGVVVGIELRLHALPALQTGAMFWTLERAREVLGAWHQWCRIAPDEISTSGRFLRFPPDPAVPEPLRGGAFFVIDGAFAGDADSCDAVLRPLRDLEPFLDTFGPSPLEGLVQLHMDPPHPVPVLSTHALVSGLDDAALDALVEAGDAASGTSLMVIELRQLGGAMARRSEGGGAVDHLEAEFAFFACGAPMGPATPEQIEADLAGVLRAVERHACGTVLTFSERPGSHRPTAETAAHLCAIKAQYDAGDVVRSVHPPRQ